ncbi:MAG TPA: GNAT family N-acetyltransferase [Thermomicrobiales bacterium]|nr:GNAT family N-acetyltransferase [Thermomicrobiales bacterium]
MQPDTGAHDEHILTGAYDNAIGVLRALAQSSRTGRCSDGDGIILVHTGSPVSFFNPAFVTRVPRDVSGMFRRIDAFYHEQAAPMVLYARPADAPGIEPYAAEAGFRRGPDEKGLLLSAGGRTAPPPPDGLEIVVVRDAATLDAFHETSARAFEVPSGWLGDLDIDRLLAISGLTLYVGLARHEPVSTGALFVTGDVAGVHIIGTLAEHRRRGIGEAMTWRAIHDGTLRGCRFCALTSSAMSHHMYQRMGFEHVVDYAVWER